jgi:hypothetical protein
MLSRCGFGAAVVLAALAWPAQAQVQLEWKFKEGDKFYLETVSVLKQTMKTLGKELKQDLEHTTLFSFVVQKKESDNSAVLEAKIESVAVKNLGGPTGEIPAQDKFNQLLKGATFRISVSPRGEVTRFEGYKELIDKIAGEDEAARQNVKAVLSEEYLKRSATEVFVPLPAGAVKPGDSWGTDKKQELRLGPLGTFTTTRRFTYNGKEVLEGSAAGTKPLDKISLSASATYAPPKAGEASPFPFQVTKGDLKADDIKGTTYFDGSAGRTVESMTTMHLHGTLTIVVGGNTIDTEMQQDQNVKFRILDKPPQ